jgi:cation transport ATPase
MMPVALRPFKTSDRIAKYFVPIVVGVAVLVLFWAKFGPEPNALIYGFINAVAVLIIACPCAFGISYADVSNGRSGKERNLVLIKTPRH